ncbi:MAG: hypothetical protein Q7K55_06350, partial [Candidatus Levybacteria bacterium]|nr:hypothetical protein [Candidatus Levybacteria bacterium]
MWRKRFKKKSSGRRNKILLLAGIILVITALFVLTKSNLFVIKKIDITANNAFCTDNNQLRNALGVLGQNSLFANFNNVEKNIKTKFVCIKKIDLSLFFPDGARVRVIGRQSVASLASLKTSEATTSSFLETIATPSAG